MPNCHWFGTLEDHTAILSEIIGAGEVDVYELASQPGQNVRAFSNVEDVLAEFDVPHQDGSARSHVFLNLWVKGSGPNPEIERRPLDPSQNNGTSWKERTGTMGFVDFVLERPSDGRLRHSQTNTVSETRMGAEDGIFTDHKGESWDVRLTNRYSARLNRLIRKHAVAKVASMSVLPGAAQFWEEGGDFDGHYSKVKNAAYYQPPA
ncbi:hypothetical protein [Pseudophaeobacter sp. EL27]|uniref:hypothetical protein n=1 Tax=Pseudophaeobacter sp. EL27 TaxID=2107580 RepID=UPI000EFA7FFF|nr:hypothetical protein [Pseudophaeobacter sp. EL27]